VLGEVTEFAPRAAMLSLGRESGQGRCATRGGPSGRTCAKTRSPRVSNAGQRSPARRDSGAGLQGPRTSAPVVG